MYTIEIEPERRLVRVVLAGFWSVEEANAFAAEQQAAVRTLGPPYGSHLTLADVRDFAVQKQEVSAAIRDLVLNAAATSSRIAVVGGSGLALLQFRRITQREGARQFDDLDEAERWLLASD